MIPNSSFFDPEKFNDQSYRASSKFIGDVLELSTYLFQEYEVNKMYNLKDLEYEILLNKKLNYQGVDFEIDVWVHIKAGNRHSRIILFECKNWSTEIVEPKHVNDFLKKIEYVNSLFESPVNGVFIAKKFTKSAQNLAKINKENVTILRVKETPIDAKFIPRARYLRILNSFTLVLAHLVNGHIVNLSSKVEEIKFSIENVPSTFKEVFKKFVDIKSIYSTVYEEVDEKTEEGLFTFSTNRIVDLINGDMYWDGKKQEVKYISFEIHIEGFWSKSRFISKFDFENDHRVVIQEIKNEAGDVTPIIFSSPITP